MSIQSLILNYPKKWLNPRFNNFKADGRIVIPKASILSETVTVLAGPPPNGTVTLNAEHGLISVTGLTTTPTEGVFNIALTNSKIGANDTLLVFIAGFSGATDGSQGLPYVEATDPNVAGTYEIRLMNVGNTAHAFNAGATVTIEFFVIHNQ